MGNQKINISLYEETTIYNFSQVRRLEGLSRNISWNEEQDEDEEYFIFDDPKLQTILLVLYSLVFCFCFLGNLTVVLVTKLHWKMRGVTKFCLGNLAFANLCVSIFCIYQNLSLYLMDTWIFGDVMCKMYHFINNLIHTASILILVVIAVERYLAILHPFKCRRILTTRKLRIIILGVWIVSALLCSPRLYFIIIIKNMLPRSKGEPPSYEVFCSIGSSLFDSRIMDWMQFILLFFLPLLIITILYARIAHALHNRQFLGGSSRGHLSKAHRSNLPSQTMSDDSSAAEETPGNSAEISNKQFDEVFEETSADIFRENSDESVSENSDQNFDKKLNEITDDNFDETSSQICSEICKGSSNAYSTDQLELNSRLHENAGKTSHENLRKNFEILLPKVTSKETSFNKTLLLGEEQTCGKNCIPEPANIFDENIPGISETRENRKEKLSRPKLLSGCCANPALAKTYSKKKPKVVRNSPVIAVARRHAGVVRMLVLIVVTFAICNLPFYLRKLYQHHLYARKGESVWTELSAPFTFLLMYANCAINPFLYAFMSKSFRSCTLDLVKCNLSKPR